MKKIPFLLRALPLLALWLIGGRMLASTPVPGPTYATSAPSDFCELPPPDTVWIVGATTNSIHIAWSPVSGAYSYQASVTNLDGGSAPPPQTILAPQTDATFFVSPGKYKFEVKATSCPGGSYGQGTTVIGSTAIIIDEVVLEFCTPNHTISPIPSSVIVCLPYGSDPGEQAPVRVTNITGKATQQNRPDVNWNVSFKLMMPCPGGWAYQISSAQNVNVGGTQNPNGSFSELVFTAIGNGNPVIFKIDDLSWCGTSTAFPCPDGDVCGHGFGMCRIDFASNPANVIINSIVDNNNGPTGDMQCMGKAPGYSWCINSNTKRVAPPSDPLDPHTFTPSDGNEGAGLLRVAPNPFTHGTTITFGLPEDTPLLLTLYDAMGRPVKTIEQTELAPAGTYRSELDADELPPGMYFLMLQTGKDRQFTTIVKSE